MILLSRYGDFVVPECNDLIVNSLRYYGEWAQAEINILSHFIEQGNVVVDAGSFIGTHARAFSTMVGKSGKVYAFEPNSLIIPFLEENAARSPLLNIVVYPFALGATHERRALISDFNENQGGARLVDCEYKNSQKFVDVKPLDACGIEKVDFIKADVEGMELALLKGAEELINVCKPVIFVEANSLEAAYSVVEWSRHRNYLVYGIITMAFNPDNFNHEQDNIFGQSKECGLLLIYKENKDRYLANINMLNLPEIITADDLALLLLHKPQYVYEVLEKSKVASILGIDYPSPSLKKIVAEYNSRITSLNQQLARTEQAKDFAEQLALQRLAELKELEQQLALTQNAKDEAERFALQRFAELEELEQRLALTQNAKDEAERLALQRLSELEEFRRQFALTKDAKNAAEYRVSALETQLDAIQSSAIWRLATKFGLNPVKGRKPRE